MQTVHNVGFIDLALGEPNAFPADEAGFIVQWRSAPKGVGKAMRLNPVGGVMVQCDLPGLDSAATIFRAAARQDKTAEVWLAMMSAREVMVAKIVFSRRRDGYELAFVDHALTPRELEVLSSIRQGSTNRAIATDLGISLSTVKRHVEHILEKMPAKNRAQAAARQRQKS